MKLSHMIKSIPKEKGFIALFCNTCKKVIDGPYINVAIDKTVIVDMPGGAKPVPLQISVDICKQCFGEYVYETTLAHRQVSVA